MIIGTGFIIMYEMYLIKKLIVQQFVQIEWGCVIIDYGHLWCTLLLYIV